MINYAFEGINMVKCYVDAIYHTAVITNNIEMDILLILWCILT